GQRLRGSAPRAGARRSRGAGAHRRQDDSEGCGREGATGQCRGVMTGARSSVLGASRERKAILCVLCVLGGFFFSSCGYSLAGHGAFLPAYIKTIGIPTFINRTVVFNLETLLTQKVR